MTRETYELTLQADGTGPEALIRIRQMLKRSLRSYGLRCVGIREVARTTIEGVRPDARNAEGLRGCEPDTDTPDAPELQPKALAAGLPTLAAITGPRGCSVRS